MLSTSKQIVVIKHLPLGLFVCKSKEIMSISLTHNGCVINQQGEVLYFCDREGLRVMRVNLDCSNLQAIVQNGDWREDGITDQLRWYAGIAVSQKLRKVFWTQKGYSKSGAGKILAASWDMPQGISSFAAYLIWRYADWRFRSYYVKSQ